MQRIGERIKRKREECGLMLNELAKRVGVSSSALSQIEKSKAFPTIVTLKQIAVHLNTTVGELIGENESENNPVLRKAECRHISTNDFGAKMYALTNQELNKIMDTFMIRFSENSSSIGLFGKLSGQIYAHVLKGELQFDLDNVTYNLEEGDNVYFNSRRNFRFSNNSKNTAELICVTSFQNT